MRGLRRPLAGQRQAERTLAAAHEHGLPVARTSMQGVTKLLEHSKALDMEDTPQGGGIRFRFREQGKDLDYGW
jgi:hypothetical protein